jgi:hypothetical protein
MHQPVCVGQEGTARLRARGREVRTRAYVSADA